MHTFRLLVDLVTGLAWPIVLLWIVLPFRKEIRAVLTERNATLKAGPFEFGIEQARVDVEAATTAGRSTSPPGGYGLDVAFNEVPPDLIAQADLNPTATIIRAYVLVEDSLRSKLAGSLEVQPNLEGQSGVQLAVLAGERGLITPQAVEAVRGVAVLRNLAAHGQQDVNPDKARDYLSLVDATLFSLRATPRRGNLSSE